MTPPTDTCRLVHELQRPLTASPYDLENAFGGLNALRVPSLALGGLEPTGSTSLIDLNAGPPSDFILDGPVGNTNQLLCTLPLHLSALLSAAMGCCSIPDPERRISLPLRLRDCVVLVVDIKDSTARMEQIEGKGGMSIAFINDVLEPIVRISTRFHGSPLEFHGDSVCIIFGGDNAAARALAAVRAIQSLASERQGEDLSWPNLRIALGVGDIEIGSIGTEVSSRLCATGSIVHRTFKALGGADAVRLEPGRRGSDVLMTTRFHVLCAPFIADHCRETRAADSA